MTRPSLGEQELALLRYLLDHAPASVGEIAEEYGAAHGLARTTILTMMERLRKKGYLERERVEGVNRYRTCVTQADLQRTLVRNFTMHILGGSVQPFVAYLTEDADLSEDEVTALRALVAKLDEKQGGE